MLTMIDTKLPSAFTFGCLDCSLFEVKHVLKEFKSTDKERYTSSSSYDFQDLLETSDNECKEKEQRSYDAVLFEQLNSDKIIVVSNVDDGWITLYNSISKKLETNYFLFFMCDDSKSPNARNGFHHVNFSVSNDSKRIVYSMRDPKWVFYQEGAPLWFEDLAIYRKRIIKERMNKSILHDYCIQIGIDFEDPLFFSEISKGVHFQYKW